MKISLNPQNLPQRPLSPSPAQRVETESKVGESHDQYHSSTQPSPKSDNVVLSTLTGFAAEVLASLPLSSNQEPQLSNDYQLSAQPSSKSGKLALGTLAGIAVGIAASAALPSSILGGISLGIAAAVPSAFAGGVAGMKLTHKPNDSGLSSVVRAVLGFGAGAATGAIAGGAAGALIGMTVPTVGIAAGGGMVGAFLAS